MSAALEYKAPITVLVMAIRNYLENNFRRSYVRTNAGPNYGKLEGNWEEIEDGARDPARMKSRLFDALRFELPKRYLHLDDADMIEIICADLAELKVDQLYIDGLRQNPAALVLIRTWLRELPSKSRQDLGLN